MALRTHAPRGHRCRIADAEPPTVTFVEPGAVHPSTSAPGSGWHDLLSVSRNLSTARTTPARRPRGTASPPLAVSVRHHAGAQISALFNQWYRILHLASTPRAKLSALFVVLSNSNSQRSSTPLAGRWMLAPWRGSVYTRACELRSSERVLCQVK